MSVQNKNITPIIQSLLLISSFVFIVFTAHELAFISKLQDLSIYWTAAHTWLIGENPYELSRHQEYVSGEVGFINLTNATLKVWSPPYFLVPMSLFAIWNITVAKLIFIALLLAQVLIWTYKVIKLAANSNQSNNPLLFFTKISGYLGAFPIWVWASAFFWGGMGILSALAPLLMTFVKGFGAVWHWTIFWLLLSLKPHIAFFGSLFILYALPKEARIRSLKGFGLASAIILSVLTLYSPQVFSQYLSLDASVVNQFISYTSTLNRVIGDLGFPREVYYIVAGGFFVLCAWFLKRPIRLDSLSEIIALSIIVNHIGLFASPYAWAHDYQVAAGWLWATLVLGITKGPLSWLNLSCLISFNLATLIDAEGIVTYLWWLLSILNVVQIYRTKKI
jgi:hypothetical protein